MILIVKYFENRLIFDEVKAYQKTVPFLGHSVYGVKNFGRCFFRFIIIHAFNRRTDGFTIANTALYRMQLGKNVNKSVHFACSCSTAYSLNSQRRCYTVSSYVIQSAYY